MLFQESPGSLLYTKRSLKMPEIDILDICTSIFAWLCFKTQYDCFFIVSTGGDNYCFLKTYTTYTENIPGTILIGPFSYETNSKSVET